MGVYRHLWKSLEPCLDKLVRAVAQRHVGAAHLLQRQSKACWLINVEGITKNNMEMIAAAIQEEVLLILEREAACREEQLKKQMDEDIDGQYSGAGFSSKGKRAGPKPDIHDPFNPTKPLFFRANVGRSQINKCKKDRPILIFDGNGEALMPQGVQIGLRPILYRGNEGMTAFIVCPQLVYQEQLLNDHEVLPEDAPIELILKLDLQSLKKAKDVLVGLKLRGAANRKVVCPVHYRTLADKKACASYLEAFHGLSDDFRATLGVEVHHVPSPWYAPTLAPLLAPLKGLGLPLFMRVGIALKDAKTLVECGVSGVGVSFCDVPISAAAENCAKRFVQVANRERLRTLACDLNTEEAMKLAEKTGFGRLAGDAIQIQV